MKVTHEFHNPVADASTGGITKPSHWNADHVIKDGTPVKTELLPVEGFISIIERQDFSFVEAKVLKQFKEDEELLMLLLVA